MATTSNESANITPRWVNFVTSNAVGGNQYNNTYQTNYNLNIPQGTIAAIAPSASFNDAPLGLLSAHFSGRQKELAYMIKALNVVRGDVPTRFALYAGPGVGKSQLTLALAKESFAQGRYMCIFWIPATTIEKLHQGFSRLLHLVGHPDRSSTDEMVRLMSARRWLEAFSSGRWLLVLDNVVRETVDFLREHLPRTNNLGNILFTTRTKDVASALAHTSGERLNILELRIPDVGDAARLLRGHFDDGEIDRDESKGREVVKCVGCLPLAIAQAAAYMKQTGCTLDALLSIYNSEHNIDMMKWENDLSTYQEKSVAAVFTFQLDDLQRQFPDVSNLLKILAYFDPESIPLEMLITGARILSESQPRAESNSVPTKLEDKTSLLGKIKNKLHWPYKGKEKGRADEPSGVRTVLVDMSSLLALILSPMGLPYAIAQLQNRSLTKQQGTGLSVSLWMHDLTRLIVLDNTKKSGAEREWFEIAVELACSAFKQVRDPELPESWGQCEVLIPHIQSLTNRQGIFDGANSSLLFANYQIARYLKSRGRYNDAEVLFKQVLLSSENQLGPEHVSTLDTKHSLAAVYIYQGRYSDAEVLYKQVLSSWESQLGSEHASTLAVMSDLALVYDKQGRYRDAEVLFKQVLSNFETQFGPEHINTLPVMANLAGVYDSQKRYRDAEVLYKQVLSSQMKQFGSEHLGTLITMNNLALVYNSQGRYQDAKVLFKQALSSREKQLGLEHVDTLMTKHNLAGVYNSQGRYRDAEVLFKQVLSSREKQLGPEHIDTITTKHSLASVRNSQGHYAEAEALLLHVLPVYERLLGFSHPHTQNARRLLADVYTNQGRLDDAEKLTRSFSSSPP